MKKKVNFLLYSLLLGLIISSCSSGQRSLYTRKHNSLFNNNRLQLSNKLECSPEDISTTVTTKAFNDFLEESEKLDTEEPQLMASTEEKYPYDRIDNIPEQKLEELKEKVNNYLISPSVKEKRILKRELKSMSQSSANSDSEGEGRGGKRQWVALLLCILLGPLGAHLFYLGYTGKGVLYIFTGGLFLIGWIIDLILLITPNGLSPKGKTSYKE